MSKSYGELDQAIDSAAKALSLAGVRPRHSVGIHLKSGVDYIVQSYAVWRIGGSIVPIALELSADEKREVLQGIAMDFLVSDPSALKFADAFKSGEARALSPRMGLVPLESPVRHPPGFEAVNAAFIRFTSGTTGRSKGVVLSHETIAERIHAANRALAIGPEDRVMWLLSMSYHFTVSIVGYLTFGAGIILAKNGLAGAILEACEAHAATLIYGSPAQYALMADAPLGKPIASLRAAISTTTSIDPDICRRFDARYGLPIAQALGLIELGLPCINLKFAREKSTSVGQVLPDYRIRLVDEGFGPGLSEVFFSGPGFLDAYYRPWQPRAQILDDGWFATRDVGELDADGNLFLRGRSKDVISVMGMKFFPQEVEKILAEHPAVREAAVYGVSHDRAGQVVRARVVLRQAALEKELLDHCSKHLAGYKVPELIEFVNELPRTASGKVLHRI